MSSQKPIAIEVNGLTRRFGKFTAVDEVSFSVPRGEIFGLLGPNGAGKTTTMRMLCGILQPTSGSVHLLDIDVTREPEKVKRNLGYMSQKFSLYNDLTVAENIDFYAHLYSVPQDERAQRERELIAMAGLEGREGMLTAELSGAWRQRLALACAIAHRPPLLFLDEPTAGVDPVSRREFWDMIYDLAGQGVTVLATTHYMDEAEFCNQIGMMYAGHLVALNDPDGLKASLPGALFELECDQPARAEDLLKERSDVEDVAFHGILLHVLLSGAKAEKKVLRALEEGGVGVTRWERILPSLEDVFVTLVERENRGGARAAGDRTEQKD